MNFTEPKDVVQINYETRYADTTSITLKDADMNTLENVVVSIENRIVVPSNLNKKCHLE